MYFWNIARFFYILYKFTSVKELYIQLYIVKKKKESFPPRSELTRPTDPRDPQPEALVTDRGTTRHQGNADLCEWLCYLLSV